MIHETGGGVNNEPPNKSLQRTHKTLRSLDSLRASRSGAAELEQ